MRPALVAAVTLAATLLAAPAAAAQNAAVPCTTATAPCERWIPLGGAARSMAYASFPLDRPNPAVTRALVMVHGAGRNADHYFVTATAAGFLAGALENTIILAPRFIAAPDVPQANEVLWPNRGDSWRSGGMSPSHPTLSSFDFADEIVRRLADRKNFPNLKAIVIAGHSAGGQFANRYGMASKAHGALRGIEVSYVVANPSSYAWPASVRPLTEGDASPVDPWKAALEPNGEKLHTQYGFGPFDSTKAPGFDRWPAGLNQRTGYTAGTSDEQLRKQLVERRATYLLGQVDVLPLGGFDSSPSAMAQGPTRRARGEAYFKYVTETMGARHAAIIVSECGHNDRCIFTTDVVLPVLFPK